MIVLLIMYRGKFSDERMGSFIICLIKCSRVSVVQRSDCLKLAPDSAAKGRVSQEGFLRLHKAPSIPPPCATLIKECLDFLNEPWLCNGLHYCRVPLMSFFSPLSKGVDVGICPICGWMAGQC